MSVTFKEKSLWIQIVTLSLVFGSYFLALDYTGVDRFPPNLVSHFIGLLVVLTVLTILGHIFAAAFNEPENEDERDLIIELKATRIKAFLLASSIEDIYQKGLTAPLMNPEALRTFKEENTSQLLQSESIRNLKFTHLKPLSEQLN